MRLSASLLGAGDAPDNRSAAYKRFREGKLRFEAYNEFKTDIKYTDVTGIGFEEGVTRRDPSGVIKVGDLYYVWYTRPPTSIPRVGLAKAKENPSLRAYHWDLAEIWYATSPDGYHWTEKGRSVSRGPAGGFDARSVFTADILAVNGKYYLFYQAAGSLDQGTVRPQGPMTGDFRGNVIAMSWADSPDGPWHRWDKPILEVGPPDAWDGSVMHDPSLIVRNGQYWLYYKSSPRNSYEGVNDNKGFSREFADMNRAIWGVAMADRPEGPYVKSKFNPVLISGHEVIVWPYRQGVCAFMSEGPERNSIQYAEDGINFYPVYHGLRPPEAAGVFRADNFVDTDIKPGPGITWGLCHILGDWNYLKRFDLDLTVEKGDRINALYEPVRRLQQESQK
ncbi:MAG: family 43 glycosylhydrolase [Lacunisphaera sp.]|nr:family 43 glycosylhydrolase [Lacunisphaera sp.]